MRLKDLKWHIVACVILILSYTALAVCFYLPMKGKVINTIGDLSVETIDVSLDLVDETINTYYTQFVNGNCPVVVTDFNKTGFSQLMKDKRIKIAEGKEFLNRTSTELYVLFYNPENEENPAGYIKIDDLLKDLKYPLVIFNANLAIKYNAISLEAIGTMNGLVNDDNFVSGFGLDNEGHYSKNHIINGVDGVLAVGQLYNYYFGVFLPINETIMSVDWVLQQAIVFFVVGIVLVVIIVGILILGCYNASKLLRVDRRSLSTPNSIVVRAKRNGQIIFTNVAFKKLMFKRQIESMDDFKEVASNKPISVFFKNKKNITCYYSDGEITRYFQFVPIAVLSTYYLVGSDITEEHLRIKELEEMNGRNEFTGAYNHFALHNLYPSILASTDSDLAIIEFCIMRYSEIVSLFGKENYYIVINEVIKIIKEQFEDAEVFHTSEERLVVLFPNLDINDIVALAKTTLDLLRKPIFVKRNNIYVRTKIVIFNIKQEDFELNLSEIERRMDVAYDTIEDFIEKDIVVYEPAMEGVVITRSQIEEDLKKAIENNEFVQYLQPQCLASNTKVVGFESLIRWNNPKYYNKSIQSIIEIAENKGFILDISKIVIDNTFKLAKLLEKYNVTISMNVSPIQIVQVGFVSDLVNKFEEYKLKPGSIALEITETFLMENFMLVNEKLKVLKKMGFKIHLDDFGTGYSSMSYLKELPIDTIKIDYEFTKHVDTNKVNYSIVSCIATLAKELDLDVIVEGVETNSQRETVKKLGCKIIQGWLISKAMGYEEAVEFIEKHNKK